jgi:peptide/nickel transport system substrate-binding protein
MGYQSFVDPDAYFYRQMHSKSSSSWTNIKNDTLDGLLDKGRTTMDQNERQKIYRDVQKILIDDALELILYGAVYDFHAMRPHVKGFTPMTKTLSRGPQLMQTWLDK